MKNLYEAKVEVSIGAPLEMIIEHLSGFDWTFEDDNEVIVMHTEYLHKLIDAVDWLNFRLWEGFPGETFSASLISAERCTSRTQMYNNCIIRDFEPTDDEYPF